MADNDDKTEDATSKKIEDSKKEGNVPKSAEVPGAAVLFFSSIYLLFLSGGLFQSMQDMIIYCFSFVGRDMQDGIYYTIVLTVVKDMLVGLLPLFFLIVFLAVIFNVMQFGFIVTPLKFELSKLNPISGFKNLFSMKKFLETLKLTAKLAIIFVVMAIILGIVWDDILSMMDQSIQSSLKIMLRLTIYFLLTILLIIIIFAIIDFFFTRHYYFEQLKMSKQDIKDEHKQMEGDPLIKGRIRQIQMQMSRKSMMAQVPEADVVITNPTHYSVALKYDDEKSSAPVVVAKGIDFLALKIRDIARDSKIPIIEDPILARAIYDNVEVEREIPEEFYKAMAEIFTYVYKLNGKIKQ